MANDYIARPDARFHAWQNNFVTYVNGHLAELGLEAADVMGAEIRVKVGDRPPTPPPRGWRARKTQS